MLDEKSVVLLGNFLCAVSDIICDPCCIASNIFVAHF